MADFNEDDELDEGGAMQDEPVPGSGNDPVSLALAAVESAMQYGRKRYGLGGGAQQQPQQQQPQQQAPEKYSNFRRSENVEDRRDQNPAVQNALSPIYNFAANARSVYDQAFGDGINKDDEYSSMSEDAGVKDIGSPKSKTLEGLGDLGVGDEGSRGAIPDEEEQ